MPGADCYYALTSLHLLLLFPRIKFYFADVYTYTHTHPGGRAHRVAFIRGRTRELAAELAALRCCCGSAHSTASAAAPPLSLSRASLLSAHTHTHIHTQPVERPLLSPRARVYTCNAPPLKAAGVNASLFVAHTRTDRR